MNKLLVQLVLVVSSVILISGCTNGGSKIVEEDTDVFFDPLPTGSPVFAEVVEPYYGASTITEDAISLFSYKSPESAAELATEDEPDKAKTKIISADSNIIISLNTAVDNIGRDEYTLLAKNDSVYLVNHISDEIRLLSHFTNTVCEIIPAQSVQENNDISGEKELTVVHDELVYVMTAENDSQNNNCTSTTSKKRFYTLPLDHQLEISLSEGLEIDSLVLAPESLARSQLIFGWIGDVGQEVMEYAYLGYDSEAKKLTLFDKDKNITWSQDRAIQQFDVVDLGQGQKSSKYMFNVQALENQFYLIQLGLDVFVVDSGLELLSKTQNEAETILSDKVASLTALKDSELTYALPVITKHDDDNLFIFDKAKIYHALYQANAPVRNPTQITRIIDQNSSFDGKNQLGDDFKSQYFSQFDLKACDADDFSCIEALDVGSQAWQFFTPCEEQFGCLVTPEVNDFCVTQAEWLQNQSDQTRCTPSDYRHIAELNDISNDAKFLSYMQYAGKYTQHNDFILHNDQLYVITKMNHKDVLLRYNFKLDFSQPKLLREQVLIGKRASLVGMNAAIANNNLFLTALEEGAIRSNEYYKNGQKVIGQPDEMFVEGSAIFCTGFDLSEGLCVNQFKEYESKAFFCSEDQLNDLTCSDANLIQLDDLAVEIEDDVQGINEDAKWLTLYDYRDASNKMYLMVGDHTLALETRNLDEGKLYNPSLYSVDQTNGQRLDILTTMNGSVEALSNAWISKDPEQGVSEVFGHINVISQEIQQTGGAEKNNKSKLVSYLLEQTFEDSNSITPDVIKAPKVAERLFELD